MISNSVIPRAAWPSGSDQAPKVISPVSRSRPLSSCADATRNAAIRGHLGIFASGTSDCLRLTGESGGALAILRELCVQELERDVAVRPAVPRAIDFAHSSGADPLEEP